MSPGEYVGLSGRNMFHKHRPEKRFSLPKSLLYLLYRLVVIAAMLFAVNASTSREMWPWVAFVPALKCTGAIVHQRWLLTSSQCFNDRSHVPSELFIEVQEFTKEGRISGLRRIFVIDYTRDKRLESTHGLTMMYLARTIPSLTRKVVTLRAKNSTISTKNGIVVSWDSLFSKIGSASTSEITPASVNIIALSVAIEPCAHHPGQLCALLDKHLSRATGISLYCSRVSLGSALLVFDGQGRFSLVGVLRHKSDCRANTKVLGRFSRVDHAREWIRRQFRIQDFPQCKSSVYRTLDDQLRDLRNGRTGPSVLCDTKLARAWYKLTLQGQPAELPTSCPGANSCGSSSAVWLPQADDVIEIGKQVEIKACAPWTTGQRYICCLWRLSVFVRHCGDFKVYRLRRTETCPTSYCANVTRRHCGIGQTGYQPNCRDSYPKLPQVLRFYPFFAYQGRPKRPYVYLRCLLHGAIPGDENIRYLFTIFKLVKRRDGTVMKRLVRSLETSRKYFDTLFIPRRHKIELGDTVVCEARSYYRSTKDIRSPPLSSKIYHLGIKVHPSSAAVLTSGQSWDITFTTTLPVLCSERNSNCSVTIPLTTYLTDITTGHIVDSSSYFTLSKCSLVFTPKRCDRHKLDCGKQALRLKAGTNLRKTGLRLQIKLGPVVSNDAVWTHTNFPVVDVTLKPSSRFICYVLSTSNIKTFDGSFFKHLGEGTFLLYRSVSPPVEVQMQKWRCNGVSTCPCAVAIREGSDVIIADMCSGAYKRSSLRFMVRSELPLHQHTRIVQENAGKTFTVRLPSGSSVTIDEFEWGISILVSAVHLGDPQGLCRGLNAPSAMEDKAASLFDTAIVPLKPSTNTKEEFCACSGMKTLNLTSSDCVVLTVSQSLGYGSRDVTQKIVDKQKILIKDFSVSSSSQGGDHIEIQADSPSLPLSYDRRHEICEAILNGTDALLMCKNVLGKDFSEKMWQLCIQETQEGADLPLLQSNGKAVTRLCKQKLDEYEQNHILVRKWKNELCENRCGRNGNCYNGNCKCDEGYGSSDCSVPLSTPPKIFPLDEPLCDDRHEPCEDVFISGTPFLDAQSLSCSFTPVQKISDSWKEDKRRMFTSRALHYSLRGVICVIPRNRRSSVVKSQEIFYIRVSNDGSQWSKPTLRILYDSLCRNCTTSGQCLIKPNTCDIQSRCFIHGDIHPSNRCLKCLSSTNPHKWSPRQDNLPPIFTSPVKKTITVFINDLVSFVVKATDPERHPMKITHDVPRAQLTANGEFRWRPERETKKTIQFLATDECGQSAAKYVDVVVRPCLCRNGGKCPKTTNATYQCICPESFKGIYCENKLLSCSSNPCIHGACLNDGDNFRCMCDVGYRGDTCHVKVPACYSNPCKRGSCEDLVGGFRCKCPQFYEGRRCEKEVDPCSRAPCFRGTCKPKKDKTFRCICPPGFYGNICSRKVGPCTPNPCHGGRCVELGTSMRCICPPKQHGKFCNLTSVYCGNKLCVNGVCASTVRGQRCACRKGYTGEQCDMTCTVDCVNGECVRVSRGTTCVCHGGYTGAACNIKRNPCEPNPCARGWCINRVGSFLCHCFSGYSGRLCNISACASTDCGNGTCILVSSRPACRCFDGFLGNRCERRRHPCDSNPCYSGLCVASDSSFRCSCNPGYQGLLCDQKTDPCLPNPCVNGLCSADVGGTFSCACSAGYIGPLCKTRKNPCFSNPCVHGTCSATSTGAFQCKCHSGFVGMLCERRFNICSSNPCVNGRCSSVYEGTFFCTCARGFSGMLCEIDQRPCSKKPCFEGVSCTNLWDTFKCGDCPTGFVGDGVRCRPVTATYRAEQRLPCPRQFCYRGVDCSVVGTQIHCGKCPDGYYGNGFDCQAVCKRACLNGGRCISPDECHCPFGFYGERCEKARCQVRCLNGGRCVPPDKCQCTRGYAGNTCEQAVCSLPCLNGGLCIKPGTCRCPPGYFGTRCQEGTCIPQCRNGGTCVRNNICACPKGYRGHRCQTAVCRRPCQNGGRCYQNDKCSCPYGYWGDTCQHAHCFRPCLNGGVCIRPNSCLCPTDYAGLSCERYVG